MIRVGRIHTYRYNCLANNRSMSLAKRILEARLQVSGAGGGSSHSNPKSNLPTGVKSNKYSSESNESNTHWPRKIFSGIQPTGSLHLGNYFGAVRKWLDLQKSSDNMTICIVDMHSITLPHNPPYLRENIFTMAATLLACGIDPSRVTLFVQSAVMEHAEFNWILSSLTTMPRLAQLPQFKEKSKKVRDVPLGLYVYPVLQAADIMLYKATHVPVGADQLQHIQLAQHLARNFNGRYGEMFPVCTPIIGENDGSRILSLRDSSKKMSKSDLNAKGTICLTDSADQIREKVKKAITDFNSDITYNPSHRPGVSNLVSMLAQVTNKPISTVVEEANTLDTARFKDRVAEALIEHLRPIREKIDMHLANRNELAYMLDMGAEKARQTAHNTMTDVKQRLGLGTYSNLPDSVKVAPLLPEHPKLTASQRLGKPPSVNAHQSQMQPDPLRYDHPYSSSSSGAVGNAGESASAELDQRHEPTQRPVYRPIVPTQTLRVEKPHYLGPPRHVFKLDSFNAPNLGFSATNNNRPDQRNQYKQTSFAAGAAATGLGFAAGGYPSLNNVQSISGFKYGQNANPSALAAVTSQVSAVNKQQELGGTLAHSAYYKAAASAYNSSDPSVVNYASKPIRSSKQNAAVTGGNSAAPLSESDLQYQADEEEEEEEEEERAESENNEEEDNGNAGTENVTTILENKS